MPTIGVPAGSRGAGIRVRVKRTNLNDHFLITPNDMFRGEGVYADLSAHERIYLGTGLTYSDNYETTLEDIDECIKELGRDKREGVRRRLREAGFLTLTRISDGLSFIWAFEFHMDPLPVEDRDVLPVRKAKKVKSAAKNLPVELQKRVKPLVSPSPGRSGLGLTSTNVSQVDLTEALKSEALDGQGDVYKEEKNHLLEEPPPPTPTTSEAGPSEIGTAGAAETPGGIEDRVVAVVDQVAADRPEWSKARITGAVRRALADGRAPEIVLTAVRLVAADPETRVPGRLNEDGDWWARAARVVRRTEPAPTGPMTVCGRHGLRVPQDTGCNLCAEEGQNGAPGRSEGPDGVSGVDAEAVAALRAEARRRLTMAGRL